MNFVKKYIKMIIGIAVLIFVIIVMFFILRSNDLAGANLRTWRAASIDARTSAARVLMGTDKNVDLVVACVDKIAAMPDGGEMMARDAVALCHTGIQLKENI